MRKIPTVFRRDPDDMKRVLPEVTPGCEWVIEGEGVATRKYDGTCVMRDESGEWWARREVKPGKQPPAKFQAVETDETTGKTVGWEPIEQSPFAKFHADAVGNSLNGPRWESGTYELCGPKVNGNPEGFESHVLVPHADAEPLAWADPETLIRWCRKAGWEGVVWHHPDGRMAKLKVRDLPPSSR